MDTYSFEFELVPAVWLDFRPATTRLADLIGAHPWRASRHSANGVILFLDRFALPIVTDSHLQRRWGTSEAHCVEMQLDHGQIVYIRARIDGRRSDDTLADIVERFAATFDLSAVSADSIIAKVDANTLMFAAVTSYATSVLGRASKR